MGMPRDRATEPKKEWNRPELTVFGSIETTTLGKQFGGDDGMLFQQVTPGQGGDPRIVS